MGRIFLTRFKNIKPDSEMQDHQTLAQFMVQNSDKLGQQTLTHIGLTFSALFIALIVGLPLGIWISRRQRYAGVVLGFAGVMQTIPSIALLGFLIPVMGIGAKPAITALFLYALLPIIRNTYTGITEVDASVVDAAKGMGMRPLQILRQVQIPLAMPVILAGIRTATVISVGVATLAAYIAAGGLGEFIFGGIALNNTNMILAGAIPAALLAIIFDFLLSLLQKAPLNKLRKAVRILPFVFIALSSFYLLPASGKGLLAGFTPEFMGREDGYLGLTSKYKLHIRNVVISDAVMYKALYEKQLDVVSGYSTDGRIKAYDLVTLVDDKTIFPPYYAAPLVRTDVLIKYPELEAVLNLLSGHINDSIMTDMNYQVDVEKLLPEAVAKKFLVKTGLYKNPRQGNKGTIRLGSKIFGEQYILIEMYKMLVEGNTDLQVQTRTGLGGTKICFDALNLGEIDMYPEYTGTGLLVILQPSQNIVSDLMGNPDKAYQYVRENFLKNYQLSWLKPIGFNNAYALMMRREQANELGIKTISDLKRVVDEQ
jgi:osmoprotectant transport system permease protein